MERFNRHRADLRAEDEKKPALDFRRNGHKEEDMGLVGPNKKYSSDEADFLTKGR